MAVGPAQVTAMRFVRHSVGNSGALERLLPCGSGCAAVRLSGALMVVAESPGCTSWLGHSVRIGQGLLRRLTSCPRMSHRRPFLEFETQLVYRLRPM